MKRRHFLASLSAGAAAAAPPKSAIPRWRGFNLLDLFQAFSRIGRNPTPTSEDEFRWIRDWGFDFIKIDVEGAAGERGPARRDARAASARLLPPRDRVAWKSCRL